MVKTRLGATSLRKKPGGKKELAIAEQRLRQHSRKKELEDLKSGYEAICRTMLTRSIPTLERQLNEANLKELPMTKLELRNATLSLADMVSISAAFSGYAPLRYLNLLSTPLLPKQVASLVSLSIHLPQLATLSLIDCGIQHETSSQLVEVVAMKNLKTLHLDHNPLGESVECIFVALKNTKDSNLSHLSLKYCDISSQSAKSISDYLRGNGKAMTILDFAGNKLGNEGAFLIAESLEHNSFLKTLVLRSNNIGDLPKTPSSTKKQLDLHPSTSIHKSNLIGVHSISKQNPNTPTRLPQLTSSFIIPVFPVKRLSFIPSAVATLTAPINYDCHKVILQFLLTLSKPTSAMVLLDLKSNHIGEHASKLILDTLNARNVPAVDRTKHLVILVTERITSPLFKEIHRHTHKAKSSNQLKKRTKK